MHVSRLGHVVLRVRDTRRAEAFYAGALGIPVVERITTPVRMTFFTLGDHHDFAVIELGEDAGSPTPKTVGLAHVAFKVGNSATELRRVKAELEAAGIAVVHERRHRFTESLHVHDPDGNEVELYVDTSEAWKQELRAGVS